MAETFDEIIKKYKLAAAADGSYDTSHITDPSEKDYVDRRIAVQKSFDAVNAAAEASAAPAAPSPSSTLGRSYGSGTMAELERANALWEKTQKYMKLATKQAGMEGLGVSQTAMIRARNDHLNRIERIKEAATPVYGGGGGGGLQDYLDAMNEGAAYDEKLGENKKAVDEIYGDYSLDAEGRQAKVDALLSGISDVNMKNSIGEYVAGLEETASIVDKLSGYYKPSSGDDGILTIEDYKNAAQDGSFWRNLENEDELFSWYQSLTAKGRSTVDDYLAYIGAESVSGMIESLTEADGTALSLLSALGLVVVDENGEYSFTENATAEDIRAILDDERFADISGSLRETLEKGAKAAEAANILRNEQDLKALSEVDLRTLDRAEAEEHLKTLNSYLDENRQPNLKLISQAAYDTYLKPALDSFEEVWGKFLKREKEASEETYAKQMAGEEPIVDEGGRKWYVAKSLEGDAEAFMKENEKAVNAALGEYENMYNPGIPDKTVIEVDGVNLMYDKANGTWRYVNGSKGGSSVILDGKKLYRSHDLPTKRQLEEIKSAGHTDNDVENGKIIKVGKDYYYASNGRWFCIYPWQAS